MNINYKLAHEYTDMPGGRYRVNGPFSGEEFREDVLLPKLKQCIRENNILEIDLDETFGYPPSFLEEAFGGLVREGSLEKKELLKYIKFISDEDSFLIGKIKQYIKEAKKK